MWSGRRFWWHTRLTRELLEADLRFGQLGGEGIFDCLAEAGALEHRLIDRAAVTRAATKPPAGRALVRGDWVRRLGREPTRRGYVCNWTGIRDVRGARRLDLSDPFA